MKTNNKQFNKLIYPYILNAIDSTGYGITCNTDLEKLQFLAKTFKSEYCYPENLRYYRTYQETLKNWIMGLPSSFNIDFENYRIIELAQKWGSLPVKSEQDPKLAKWIERQEDKILDSWFNLVAFKTLQLFKKHNIEL